MTKIRLLVASAIVFAAAFGATNPAARQPVPPTGPVLLGPTDGVPYRVTTDSGADINGSIVQLGNGDVLCAYEAWRQDGADSINWVMLARSTNRGASWSSPDTVLERRVQPRIRRGLDSTVWLFTLDTTVSTDSGVVRYIRSTDNGGSWLPEQTLPTGPVCRSSGLFFQTSSGRVLVLYTRGGPAPSGLCCIASTDNGASWLPEDTLTPSVMPLGSLAQDSTGTLWAFYGGTGAFYQTSTDDGVTWARWRRAFAQGSAPRMAIDDSGVFRIAYFRSNDVMLRSSFDGGTTWGAETSLTSYVGRDSVTDIALVDGDAWVAFNSDRWYNRDVYCGRARDMYDSFTPPVVSELVPGTAPILGQSFAVFVRCQDNDGIDSAGLVYTLDGAAQPRLPLYDDGLHGDRGSLDGYWGNFVGPFPGDRQITLGCQVLVTDSTGITVLWPQAAETIPILGCHDTSNLQMTIDPYSGLDGVPLSYPIYVTWPSCEWPRGSDSNYLWSGHVWAGTVLGSDTLASDYNPNSGQSDWQVCEGDTLRWGPGVSDQDSRMRLDDRNPYSGRPIGIEVEKHCLSWYNWRYDDFIIQEYAFTNTGLNGDLDSVYIGFCHDFDVVYGPDDMADFDSTRSLGYVYDYGSQPTTGWVGVRLLSHRASGFLRFTIENDPRNDAERYALLATDSFMHGPSTAADQRVLQSVGPFPLPVGDTFRIAAAIVIGRGLAEMQVNSDTALALYSRGYTMAVDERGTPAFDPVCRFEPIVPNPTRGPVRIEATGVHTTTGEARILDLGGRVRCVLPLTRTGPDRLGAMWNATDVDGHALPDGVYFCEVTANGITLRQKVVLAK